MFQTELAGANTISPVISPYQTQQFLSSFIATLYVWYSGCGRRGCVVVSFGSSSSRSVSVTLDEVFVVVVL